MPTQFTRLDLAELILVAVGVLVILCGAVVIGRRRTWNQILSLPPPPANVLEPADMLMGLAAILLLPSIFYRLLSIGATSTTTGPATIDGDVAEPRQVLAMALGQLLGAAFIVFLCRQRFQNGVAGWGLTVNRIGVRFIQALGGYLALWPVCFGLLHLTVFLIRLASPDFKLPEHSAILTLLSDQTPPWMIVVSLMSTAIFAPTLEELFFRGLLQPALMRWTGRPWASILFAGVAFGLFHYPLIHTIPALAAFGIFLGFVYAKTRSLTLTILLHAAFNGKTLLWLAMGAE